MGLLDILTGMQNGPRGQPQPPAPGSSGGMSPITMALLALLAYKGYKHFTGTQPGGVQQPLPGGTTGGGIGSGTPGGSGGGLADILGGLFGGNRSPSGSSLNDILGGRSPGSVLNGGLGNLMRDLQNNGQGRVAQSWVGKGPNETIEPNELAKALGADTINQLTAQTGLSRDELLNGMSQQLPEMVDKLTPDGRLPTEQEAEERWQGNENENENEREEKDEGGRR
jgi:uncharacterized protein YidB (DUF937 family)